MWSKSYFDESGVPPKTEIIIQWTENTSIKFVNKEALVKEDYEEAAKVLQERREKEEEERKQREEEERLKREEEDQLK